jgi:hypothetical protein
MEIVGSLARADIIAIFFYAWLLQPNSKISSTLNRADP